MATIDSRGIVDDGSSGLSVSGNVNAGGQITVTGGLIVTGSVGGVSPGRMVGGTLPNGANTVITACGYYTYNGGSGGASSCTGTLPSAANFPGGMLVFAPVSAGLSGLFLTGTAVLEPVVFSPSSSATTDGSRLSLASSGSVALISDGRRWMQMASSGTLTFAR